MTTIDSQTHTKDAICQWLNENSQGDFPKIKSEDIISLRILENDVIALVDCGIKGVPKFTIPTNRLEFNPKPKATNGRRKTRIVDVRRKDKK